jgi:hypothetical protein
MSVNTGNVTGSGATQAYYQSLHTKKTGGKDAAPEAGAAAGDKYTAAETGTSKNVYSKDSATMQKLWSMAEAQHASMRSMVESLLGGTSGQNGQAFWAMAANKGNFDNFRVDEATQAKAQELTGEDGYFGIKKTTERIMDFAKALGGEGASEKTIENLKKGVQAGFDYVADLFGGFDKLPQLTKDTYSAVMKEFDEWVGGTKLVGG